MKIMYLVHSTVEGGATLSFLTLVKGMISHKITICIVVPNSELISHFFEEETKNMGIPIYRIYMCQSVLVAPRKIWKYPMYWIRRRFLLRIQKYYSRKRLKNLIQKINPDIIHTNTGVLHEGFEVAKELGIPHIWHLREYQDLDFGLTIYPSFTSFCKKLKESYVISITNDILSHFTLEKYDKALVVYNGVFRSIDYTYDLNKENYFLCASRISPEKGIDCTIRAFAKFNEKYKNFKLLIAGFGNDKYVEELKKLSQELECDKQIKFCGFITDIKKYMSKATALIVASYNEGFGRMTAEACFCGCIVIGRNTGGTKEILENTGGFLFDDTTDLEKKMEMVAKLDANGYDNIASLALNKAISSYSEESYVNKIHNLYLSIINNS